MGWGLTAQDRSTASAAPAVASADPFAAYRAVGTALAFAVMFVAASEFLWNAHAPTGRDFISFWSAAKMALAGNPAAAYDLEALHALQSSVATFDGGKMPFPYPPAFLLLVLPFGLLSFPAAMALWSAATFAVYLAVARRAFPSRRLAARRLRAGLRDRGDRAERLRHRGDLHRRAVPAPLAPFRRGAAARLPGDQAAAGRAAAHRFGRFGPVARDRRRGALVRWRVPARAGRVRRRHHRGLGRANAAVRRDRARRPGRLGQARQRLWGIAPGRPVDRNSRWLRTVPSPWLRRMRSGASGGRTRRIWRRWRSSRPRRC